MAVDISVHGVFGSHPEEDDPGAIVAPSTGKEFNTIRRPIQVVGCALLPDNHFLVDSSEISPSAAEGLRRLSALMQEHPDSRISVFGHADPVGEDEYNKTLSGRRALAVYGLLIHDVALWDELHAHPHGGDKWGLKAVQSMLTALSFPAGRSDGVMDDATKAAVKKFQTANGRSATGTADDGTRKAVYGAYMDFLYGGAFTQLDPDKDFLFHNKAKDHKGDVQGCGEFNPLVIFSAKEAQTFSKASNRSARNDANAVNRRVLVYLFAPDTVVDESRWPCPTFKEGAAGCRKRLFADGDKRRQNGPSRREYRFSHDTFACRFYDRTMGGSPCERSNVASSLIRWVAPTPAGKEPPVLVAKTSSGEEICRVQSQDVGSDPTGCTYHAFDIGDLRSGEQPVLSIQNGDMPILTGLTFDLSGLLSGVADVLAMAHLMGLDVPQVNPSPLPPDGPPGPDMLEVNTDFPNPLVPENAPPEEKEDDLGF